MEGGELNLFSDVRWRLVPGDPNNYFRITNYSRTMSGKGKRNFNAYRGTLEYVYAMKSDIPYIINELPLLDFL